MLSAAAKHVVREIFKRPGYFTQIDIGEMDDDGNDCHKAMNYKDAVEIIDSVDEARVYVYEADPLGEDKYIGWIWIISCNDGEEQIVDHTIRDKDEDGPDPIEQICNSIYDKNGDVKKFGMTKKQRLHNMNMVHCQILTMIPRLPDPYRSDMEECKKAMEALIEDQDNYDD